MHTPDNWVVFKVKGDKPLYKILAGWSGGYTQGDSWRVNSGITRVEKKDTHYLFYGDSGSCYQCGKQSYCLRNNNDYVWRSLVKKYPDKLELMPEDTNWLRVEWTPRQ